MSKITKAPKNKIQKKKPQKLTPRTQGLLIKYLREIGQIKE